MHGTGKHKICSSQALVDRSRKGGRGGQGGGGGGGCFWVGGAGGGGWGGGFFFSFAWGGFGGGGGGVFWGGVVESRKISREALGIPSKRRMTAIFIRQLLEAQKVRLCGRFLRRRSPCLAKIPGLDDIPAPQAVA